MTKPKKNKTLEQVLKKGEPLTYNQIKLLTGLTKKTFNIKLEEMKSGGVPIKAYVDQNTYVTYFYLQKGPMMSNQVYNVDLNDGEYLLGVYGDTHVGDKGYDHNAHLKYYDMLDDRGVELVLHAGDLITGVSVYNNQHVDLNIHTKMEQAEWYVDNCPELSKGETLIIDGNHDTKNMEKSFSPGYFIGDRKSNHRYLGQIAADVRLSSNLTARLIHLRGRAYAKCFDDKTEVLTKKGFKLFKELIKDDLLATRNEEGFLEWNKPIELFEYDYDGELLHFKARGFDLLITPNHNMLVRAYPKKLNRLEELEHPEKSHIKLPTEFGLIEAKDVNDSFVRQKWQMTKSCKWEGRELLEYEIPFRKKIGKGGTEGRHFKPMKIEQWLKFLGWFVSEGNTEGKNKHKYCTTITQIRVNYREEIENLLIELGWEYKKNWKCFKIYGAELAEHIDKICGVGANNKKVPEFIKTLKPKLIQNFIETLFKGDGSWDKKSKKFISYTTISSKLSDDLQELLLKCNIGSKKTTRGISISYEQNDPTINKKGEKVYYKGKVYCAEVKNHTMLIRRNGKMIWSGNSYTLQKYIRGLAPVGMPNMIFKGHSHDAIYMNVQGIECLHTSTLQHGISNFAKELGFQDSIGAWIITYEIENSKLKRFVPELIKF